VTILLHLWDVICYSVLSNVRTDDDDDDDDYDDDGDGDGGCGTGDHHITSILL